MQKSNATQDINCISNAVQGQNFTAKDTNAVDESILSRKWTVSDLQNSANANNSEGENSDLCLRV